MKSSLATFRDASGLTPGRAGGHLPFWGSQLVRCVSLTIETRLATSRYGLVEHDAAPVTRWVRKE